MRLLSRLVFLAVLALGGSALASVVLPLTVEQLSQKSSVVVHGKVMAQHADWTRGGRIVTTTTIAVTSALKGEPQSQVEVRTLGGTVGGIGQQVSGEVHFAAGEEVIVFLRPSNVRGGSYAVVGMAQGKFTVSSGANGTVATQNLEGLGFSEQPGAPVTDRQADPVLVRDLEARIGRAVAK